MFKFYCFYYTNLSSSLEPLLTIDDSLDIGWACDQKTVVF
jgi:hypothetical protein